MLFNSNFNVVAHVLCKISTTILHRSFNRRCLGVVVVVLSFKLLLFGWWVSISTLDHPFVQLRCVRRSFALLSKFGCSFLSSPSVYYCLSKRHPGFTSAQVVETLVTNNSSGADLGGGCRGCAPPPPPRKSFLRIYIRTPF